MAVHIQDDTGTVTTMALGEGVVLQPLAGARPRVDALAGRPGTTTTAIGAFCVEFEKAPPAPGQIYRLAPPAIQERYAPVRDVLRAADDVADTLQPNSDPATYLNSIRQYAVWTRVEGWDRDAFGEHLLERTKKNAANAGVDWTAAMEKAVSAAVPGRWRDVQAVLRAAGSGTLDLDEGF